MGFSVFDENENETTVHILNKNEQQPHFPQDDADCNVCQNDRLSSSQSKRRRRSWYL